MIPKGFRHPTELINKMKHGSYIVNTASGRICDRDAIVRVLESAQLAGYAGDVWFPPPSCSEEEVLPVNEGHGAFDGRFRGH
jgi:lactate dehydrogenase-like 2-hydroxyacid dehydrogenase